MTNSSHTIIVFIAFHCINLAVVGGRRRGQPQRSLFRPYQTLDDITPYYSNEYVQHNKIIITTTNKQTGRKQQQHLTPLAGNIREKLDWKETLNV